jgi:membrane protein DedA with SNARE-associated domain
MKYLLLSLSTIIILYGGYILIKCIQSFESLTQFGKGYLVGSIVLLAIGISMFIFSIRKIKKNKRI